MAREFAFRGLSNEQRLFLPPSHMPYNYIYTAADLACFVPSRSDKKLLVRNLPHTMKRTPSSLMMARLNANHWADDLNGLPRSQRSIDIPIIHVYTRRGALPGWSRDYQRPKRCPTSLTYPTCVHFERERCQEPFDCLYSIVDTINANSVPELWILASCSRRLWEDSGGRTPWYQNCPA